MLIHCILRLLSPFLSTFFFCSHPHIHVPLSYNFAVMVSRGNISFSFLKVEEKEPLKIDKIEGYKIKGRG